MDAIGLKPELLGDELRVSGLMALPARLGADQDRDVAIGIEPHIGGLLAHGAADFDVSAKSDAAHQALLPGELRALRKLLPFRDLHRPLHVRGEVAGVINHVGAESGQLGGVLSRLADYLEARQALRQKFAMALIYPALVTVIALSVIATLMLYVVPQIVAVYQQSRQTLPWLTRALIASSVALMLASVTPTGIGTSACCRTALPRDSTPPLSWPSPGRQKHASSK